MRSLEWFCRAFALLALLLLASGWILGPDRRRRRCRLGGLALASVLLCVTTSFADGPELPRFAQAIDNLPKAPDPAKMPEIENAAAFLKAGKVAFEVVPRVVSLFEFVQYCQGAKDTGIVCAIAGIVGYLWLTRNPAKPPPKPPAA